MNPEILLISSSNVHGFGYLEYCEDDLREILGDRQRVLFVPFALHDHTAYTLKVRQRFGRIGYALDSLHETDAKRLAVDHAEAIFVGGGNTFRLLKALYDYDLLAPIRRRVAHGVPYLGSSAGSNVAGPTIKTTNDMPICEPESFDALGLVPFQINPHYLDADPSSTHMGETREQRLREFHEMNTTPICALREGAHLRISGERIELRGQAGARIFRHGEEAQEALPGDELGALLRPA